MGMDCETAPWDIASQCVLRYHLLVAARTPLLGHPIRFNLPRSCKQMQPIALVHPKLPEASPNLGGQSFILHKADITIFAQFVVGPVLVDFLRLPVHRLLDLLGFIMRLDQSPCPQCLCVAKPLRATFNDVEDGPDIFGRSREELIFGARVSPWDSFALDWLTSGRFNAEGRFSGDAWVKRLVVSRHWWRM